MKTVNTMLQLHGVRSVNRFKSFVDPSGGIITALITEINVCYVVV